MTSHVEERLWPFRTHHAPGSTPENWERITVTIVKLPASAPGPAGLNPGHHPSPAGPVAVAGSFEDATWEDAEWQ